MSHVTTLSAGTSIIARHASSAVANPQRVMFALVSLQPRRARAFAAVHGSAADGTAQPWFGQPGVGAAHHVRALEAWVHLFPFREAHTHTCIAPLGIYRSGEFDDEASELRHRRERLLALRRARAAAAADGV